MLIVIEGIDGSGKTTQSKLLYEALRKLGYKAILVSEPSDSIYGAKIRQKLRDGNYTPNELYDLFLKDRKNHIEDIKSFLKSSYIVIMDRYYISTIAYQGAQGIPIDKIIKDHKDFPQPDILIILDINPKVALNRLGKSTDTFEKRSFLEHVRDIYLKIPELLKDIFPSNRVFIVNADRPLEQVHNEILRITLNKLKGEYNHASVENKSD